jgi:UDP-N-acetylglucosamine 2-epimerase (non-hydrolysing)
MRVLSLVGARPQIIKEAMLHREFKEKGIEEILVHSGQHYDYNMSDVFFEVLEIRQPHYNLNVGSGTHGEMTGKIMILFWFTVTPTRLWLARSWLQNSKYLSHTLRQG